MAVTGVFAADFSQFFDAVQRADTELEELVSTAGRTSDALSTTGDAFDGDPIAAELNKVGTAADHTEDELEDLGKQGGASVNALTGTIKDLALGFASIATIKSAFNFVSDIADTAGALADLSAQTRIGVEDLQILAGAMSEFGVSQDELGKALFKLSTRISKGDDSVVEALRDVGLSIEDVRGKNGVELFETIQDALANVNGEARDTTAIALYGEKLGMVMAGASSGAVEAIEKFRAMNAVISEENVRALDAAGEAVARLKLQLSSIAANTLGPVAEGWNTLLGAFEKGATVGDIVKARLKDMWSEITTGQPHVENLARVFDDLNRKYEETHKKTVDVTDAHVQFVGPTQTAAEAAKQLAAEHKAVADAAKAAADADRERMKQLQASAALEQKILSENETFRKQAVKDYAAIDAAKVKAAETADKAAKDDEARMARELAAHDAENAALIKAYTDSTEAAGAAGDAGLEAGIKTSAGFQQATQTIELSSDAINAWLDLMAYTNRANAILMENGLFTTSGQLERIANLRGDPRFDLAKNNTASGSNVTLNNTFNLTDTESELVSRISDAIMQQIRAGTQIGTAG